MQFHKYCSSQNIFLIHSSFAPLEPLLFLLDSSIVLSLPKKLTLWPVPCTHRHPCPLVSTGLSQRGPRQKMGVQEESEGRILSSSFQSGSPQVACSPLLKATAPVGRWLSSLSPLSQAATLNRWHSVTGATLLPIWKTCPLNHRGLRTPSDSFPQITPLSFLVSLKSCHTFVNDPFNSPQ